MKFIHSFVTILLFNFLLYINVHVSEGLELDSDDDGLTDQEELIHSTLPNDPGHG